MENPWGVVSLFDVYVSFFFFIGWIAYRECCPGMTIVWAIAICLGGNVVAGIYAIIALLKCKGDAKLFFLGERADNQIRTSEKKMITLFHFLSIGKAEVSLSQKKDPPAVKGSFGLLWTHFIFE